MKNYHVPVLVKEVLENLITNPSGVYIDATFGGGGHTKALLDFFPKISIIGIDKDLDAEKMSKCIENNNFKFIRLDFRNLSVKTLLNDTSNNISFLKNSRTIDGILIDLGVSSFQINEPLRGFSTRFDAALDMRMDVSSTKTAKDIIKSYSYEDLVKIFKSYGDLKNASSLATKIIRYRDIRSINTTFELKEVIGQPKFNENKYFAKIFQAIRVEVNDEYNALKSFLINSTTLLKPNGRLIALSYNSLEDRLVKRFLKYGNFEAKLVKDIFGNIIRPFEPLNRKVIVPSGKEILQNSRARSAKMRVGICL